MAERPVLPPRRRHQSRWDLMYVAWFDDLKAAADELGWDIGMDFGREGDAVVSHPLRLYERGRHNIALTVDSVFLDGAMLRRILAAPRG